jgi:hypothetical protein
MSEEIRISFLIINGVPFASSQWPLLPGQSNMKNYSLSRFQPQKARFYSAQEID